MAISKEEKARFAAAARDDRERLVKFEKRIKEISTAKKKHPSLSGYYNLELVNIYLNLVTTYLHISALSMDIQGIADSASQEKARKTFFTVAATMEEIVGGDFDRPLSENKDYLEKVDRFNIRQTLELAKKILFVYDTLVDNLGEDSKHKWFLVDMHVRSANLIKNMINFTDIEQFRNFRSEFFKDREDLLRLCKKTLEEAAKNSRSKYELSTQAPEDIKKAVYLLTALRQIHVLYGETAEAEKTRTVIDALKARVDQEEKKKEEARKKK